MKTYTKCIGCGRMFDLTDEAEAGEWFYGHDCESNDDDHIENHWMASDNPFGDLLAHLYEEHSMNQRIVVDDIDTLFEIHLAKHADLKWREDEVGMLEDSGDVGGDFQAGPAFSRRFIFGPVCDRYMVIEEYAYAEALDVDEEDERHGGYGASEMTMISICTDLDDVGGSEIAADVEYGEGGYLVHFRIEDATAAAKRLMERNDLGILDHYDPTEELVTGKIHR